MWPSELAQIWTEPPESTPKRKSPELPNLGEKPGLAARIRAGGQGRDRTADTTIFRCAVWRELAELRRTERIDGR